MKKTYICLFAILPLLIRAQTVQVNVINFEWMPNGRDMLVGVYKFDTIQNKTLASEIFLLKTKTKDISLLIKDGNNPSPSPNGRELAFGRRIQNRSHIFIYNIETNSETEIGTIDSTSKSSPQWSPDGKKIIFTKVIGSGRNAVLDICVLDLSSGSIKDILPGAPYRNYNPVWSPDGKMITYFREKGDSHDQIYIADENGSFLRNITNDTTTHNFYPSWFSNTKVLYTLNMPGEIKHAAIMNINGSSKQVINEIKSFYTRKNPKYNLIGYIDNDDNLLKTFDLKKKQTKVVLTKDMLDKK